MISNIESIIVHPHEAGIRLDKFISKKCRGISYFTIQKILRTGQVRVDGHRVKGSFRLKSGNNVRIPYFYISPERKKSNNEIDIKISKKIIDEYILYKDENIIAINKPSGLSVQGGTSVKHHLDGLLDFFKFESKLRPLLVHRLDKDTSGVMVLARTPIEARRLTLAFKNKIISKNYIALVHGRFPKKQGTISIPLEKINGTILKQDKQNKNFKNATTEYNVLWKGKFKNINLSIVEYLPVTGRKHQLRAHSYYIGCPILGDKKYFLKNSNIKDIKMPNKNMYLHAREIGIPDIDGITIRIKAPFPEHMINMFKLIGFKG